MHRLASRSDIATPWNPTEHSFAREYAGSLKSERESQEEDVKFTQK